MNLGLQSTLVELKLLMVTWKSNLVNELFHACNLNICDDIRSIFGYLPRVIRLKFELFEQEIKDYMSLPFDKVNLGAGDVRDDDDEPSSPPSTHNKTDEKVMTADISAQTEEVDGYDDEEEELPVRIKPKRVKIVKRRRRKHKMEIDARSSVLAHERVIWK